MRFLSRSMTFLKLALGLRGSETPGSDKRRFFMRICLIWSVVFLTLALVTAARPPAEYSSLKSVMAVLLISGSLLVFFQIVLLMPFRDNQSGFDLDAWRLVMDTMVSSVFMISVFSILYQNIGLFADGSIARVSARDALYFSAVTFSTLGYGDFAPHPALRMIAATQALLGNLHLGMIVGATFAALRK